MKIPKPELRCAAAPLQVVMCVQNPICKMCGAFLDVQSAIAILQFSLWSLNKLGPDSLIFFNELFFQSSKVVIGLKKSKTFNQIEVS